MISVITPVLPAHVDMLAQAHESLLSQDSGPDWEWLIQIDGTPDGPVDETFPAAATDGRIRVAANGERLGVSATRNRALLRSTGRWVAPLDADDEFFPNTLALLSEPLRTRPEVSFVFGESVDVFPDGKRLARFTRRPYEPGSVPPGRLEDIWRHHKNLFFHPGAVMFDRTWLLAAGGWPAGTEMEDQDVLLAISTFASGWYVPHPVHLYRQHRDQTVRTARFESNRESYRRWSHTRLVALRTLRGDDPDELRMLETPLPSPEEISTFTTAEWQAEIAGQVTAG
ncbi:glycosyltransferase family 2 protein [Micromonospora maris]|nr:glycosyltransferase family 2 protein [Micromonospora maris]AEB44501.1 GltA [Micromonospora maris AB-18-032]